MSDETFERKVLSGVEREARAAFRQVEATKAMTEHEITRKAFNENRERLKAERLAREAENAKGGAAIKVPNNIKWTPKEDDRLRSLIEANTTIHLVAAKLKRTMAAVRGRATLLKIPIPRVRAGLKITGK